jgi:hypothetical protein
MTLVKVTSHLYWLARPWQTPASFLPARGRINNPGGIGPDDPIGPGSVTAFPQVEQKRAPPGKDDPQPAQNEAIRHLLYIDIERRTRFHNQGKPVLEPANLPNGL